MTATEKKFQCNKDFHAFSRLEKVTSKVGFLGIFRKFDLSRRSMNFDCRSLSETKCGFDTRPCIPSFLFLVWSTLYALVQLLLSSPSCNFDNECKKEANRNCADTLKIKDK